jgi:hypothetical protein
MDTPTEPIHYYLPVFPRYHFALDGTPTWAEPPRRGRSAGKTEVKPFMNRGLPHYCLLNRDGKYVNVSQRNLCRAVASTNFDECADVVALTGIFGGYFVNSLGYPFRLCASGGLRPVLSDLRWNRERYRLTIHIGDYYTEKATLSREQLLELRSQHMCKL